MKRCRAMPTDADRRLRELAEQWALPPEGVDQLTTILALLSTEPSSVTTIRDPLQAADVHVADSLVALALPTLQAAATLADIGSGSGFPGLALAVARPDLQVTLVESVQRKCAFLEHVVAEARLASVRVVHDRVESWALTDRHLDVVTARALAPLAILAEYAAPLLKPGGALLAWKADRDVDEEAAGVAASEIVGLRAERPVPVQPFKGAGPRHLHVYVKVRVTPDRFPRRPGMARKRPLGRSV